MADNELLWHQRRVQAGSFGAIPGEVVLMVALAHHEAWRKLAIVVPWLREYAVRPYIAQHVCTYFASRTEHNRAVNYPNQLNNTAVDHCVGGMRHGPHVFFGPSTMSVDVEFFDRGKRRAVLNHAFHAKRIEGRVFIDFPNGSTIRHVAYPTQRGNWGRSLLECGHRGPLMQTVNWGCGDAGNDPLGFTMYDACFDCGMAKSRDPDAEEASFEALGMENVYHLYDLSSFIEFAELEEQRVKELIDAETLK